MHALNFLEAPALEWLSDPAFPHSAGGDFYTTQIPIVPIRNLGFFSGIFLRWNPTASRVLCVAHVVPLCDISLVILRQSSPSSVVHAEHGYTIYKNGGLMLFPLLEHH